MSEHRLRVLLIPDWIRWVTGTIAQSVARFNPWIEATIFSSSVADRLLTANPQLQANFDLVHFTCSYVSRKWVPILRDKIPCVTSHHHVSNWDLMKHNLEGDVVVVGSRQWENDLLQRGVPKERVFRLPYGVDAEKFRPASEWERAELRRKLGVPPDHVVVGFFAKLGSNEMGRKGTDIFASAIVALHKEIPALTVMIVGPGWGEFVKTLRAARLHCLYSPFIRKVEDLARMYHALDFYWVTARIEGGPVPLLEAMSSGVCCLSTPVGLARDLIKDNENAVLIPMNDASGFVARTAQLSRDPRQREALCRKARQTIVESMDLPSVYREVPRLYQVAFANFAKRTGRTPAGVIPETPSVGLRPPEFSDMPLFGVPQNLQQEVRLLENLYWGDELAGNGHKTQAFFSKVRECMLHPGSPLPWRFLLRYLLPKPLLSMLRKLRHA